MLTLLVLLQRDPYIPDAITAEKSAPSNSNCCNSVTTIDHTPTIMGF